MSTLLARSVALKVEIDLIANLERDAQIVHDLEAIAEAVKGYATQADALATNVGVLSADELLPATWIAAQEVSSLQKRVDALRKRVQTSRGDARKGNIWANCDAEAKGLAKNVTGSVESAWRRYLETLLTDTNSFSTFRNVAACRVGLRKVDDLNNTIRSRMLTLPTTRKEIAELTALGKEAKEVIGKLKLEGVPKEVQTLLKNAATGGTPLADLTDHVLEWLRKNPEYLDSLRISASPQ